MKLKVTFEHPANSWRGPSRLVWYQGGLKPNAPKGYIDLSRVGNGAIFEGTKGSIFADFTTRVIIPNNDDGDLTYYKRRGKDQLLPLIGGTGQTTQAPQASGRPRCRRTSAACRATASGWLDGACRAPTQDRTASRRFNSWMARFPRLWACRTPMFRAILEAEKAGRAPSSGDVFQAEWIDACKGKNATTSSTAPAARRTATSITPAR